MRGGIAAGQGHRQLTDCNERAENGERMDEGILLPFPSGLALRCIGIDLRR